MRRHAAQIQAALAAVPALMAEQRLAIVVVNYASSSLLARNLADVAAARPDATIVVVDNYSTRPERETVSALCEDQGWLLVAMNANPGFGAGMNRGVARAIESGASEFLLLNPDAVIGPDSLAILQQVVADHPMALVSPILRTNDGQINFDGVVLDLDSGRMQSRRTPRPYPARAEPWIAGTCVLISRRLWDAVGGFDERYFLYWEDVDFSSRVTQAGGSLVIEEHATAIHQEGGTQQAHARDIEGSRGKSTTYYYYSIRNRMLYAAIHLNDRDRRRWQRAALPVAYEILLHGGRRQFLRPGPPLRAAVRGLVDGWRVQRGVAPRYSHVADRP